MLKSAIAAIISVAALLPAATGQQAPKQQPPASTAPDKPQVRLNYLNVCAPSPEEQAVLKSALDKVPARPGFVEDFEIARGRTTLKDAPPSKFVRLRREHHAESPLLTAQYSMSVDDKTIIELLVLRMRDPKEFHEISLEDRLPAEAVSPATVLAADTPPVRIRVERLGKASIVLARCEGADQTQYERLFKEAADVMARYRSAMGLRAAFRSDIAWLVTRPAAPARNHPTPQKQP